MKSADSQGYLLAFPTLVPYHHVDASLDMRVNPLPQAEASLIKLSPSPERKPFNNIHAQDILDCQNNTQPLLISEIHRRATGPKPLELASAALR